MEETPLETLIFDALMTDGSHHKQWYIWRIAEETIGESRLREILDEYKEVYGTPEEGIAP